MSFPKSWIFPAAFVGLVWWACLRFGGYQTIVDSIRPIDAQIQSLQGCLMSYYQADGSLPQGNGIRIAQALVERFPDDASILEWSKKRKNPDGQLLDPWGTPLLLRVEERRINIRSAGDDRRYGTADDVVVKNSL